MNDGVNNGVNDGVNIGVNVRMMTWSSSFSTALYWLRSRLSVRIIIIAVTPESRRTIARELRMENQWICHVEGLSGSAT